MGTYQNTYKSPETHDQPDQWPRPGDKVIFKGTHMFWFTNIIENGKKLEIGKEYTLGDIAPASSWCSVTLEETGDLQYSLDFFKWIGSDGSKHHF